MKTILCIEDDFNSQLLLKMYFRRSDFSATIVSNGERAQALLDEQSFDIILTDWNMHTSLTSDALMKALFSFSQKTDTPIIVMTADHSLTKAEMKHPDMVSKIIYKPLIKNVLLKELSPYESISSESISL